MAEAIAFDIAAELIIKLSSRALSQVGLLWNLKNDLDDLERTVSTIKAVLLDAEERSVTDNRVKVWLEELKDVLYDADDLLDDFSTEALRKDVMGGNKLTKEVRLFFSCSNQFAYGLKMGWKIKAIKARLALIESEANTFRFIPRDRPAKTSFMTKKRLETHSFERQDEIIGRDGDKVALLKLVVEFQSEENVYIIPIVGFGGLGKTALALFVYNDEIVKNQFELMMFACVSDVFDVKVIVANIIKSITNKAPDQNLEMDQLQKQLRDKIDGKKYLLVLDDIWNEDPVQWSRLKKLLMGGAKGSRIIVTTRSLTVAKITNKCQSHVLKLKGLSHDDAWSLFKKIAFEQRYVDSTNSAFVEVGKQISETGTESSIVNSYLSAGELKHLRYLDLSHNEDLKILPKSICKIQNLQVLKLDWCDQLQELPKKIEKLVNLTHLECYACYGLTHMPRGIRKLTSLETLSSDDEKSLEDLQPHPNLKELCIAGWRGDAKFPSWFLRSQISSILKYRLEYMDDNSPEGSQGEPESFFPSLKHLHLKNCPNMKSWWRTVKPIDDDSNEDDTTVMGKSTMAFPCLSSLEIRNCPLTSMPFYPSLDGELDLVNTSSRPLKQTIKMNINAKNPSSSTSSLPLSKLISFM
ncbi:disease resistance protein RGA2-like [Gossypium australe]|uniref:Disease resistance protein RGA2-like n=1 Tax=Gossypium australe TaxID=47621 RepID=A0A5B6VRK2_9ROSI|nr:disease resistance protein RGA2-like [Gossypium australe]